MYSNQINILTSENEGGYSISPRIRKLGKRFFNLPILRMFQPHARKALVVTRPLGEIFIKGTPDHACNGACGIITVLSANLWHDWPFHRRLTERLEAFAQMVEQENVDILLLQEVARKNGFNADEWLAQRLEMAFVYSRANGHSAIGFEEGLAIFSRFPISEPQLRQLSNPSNPFVRRAMLGANLETPCGGLRAYSVHLGIRRKDNQQQQTALHHLIGETTHQSLTLVGGDFNAHETSHQIQKTRTSWLDTYRHLHPLVDGHTHTIRLPWGWVLRRHRLDYIFVLPGKETWNVVEARHLSTPGKGHSDHQAVLTRLTPSVQK